MSGAGWPPFITEAANAGSAASVPTWFTMTVAIAGPLLLLLGVLIGHRDDAVYDRAYAYIREHY